MLAKRIIPCLDCDLSVPEGRVVKGKQFKEIKYAGVPWELAEKYYLDGADEIVFLDITASSDARETMVNVIEKTCEKVFVPITVGGGIRSVADARKVFNAGADKVAVNTAALLNPKLIDELAEHFGSQAVVVAIDAKKEANGKGGYECYTHGGRKPTGIDAIEWAKECAKRGAGEILLTSIDRDGTNIGYELELTRKVVEVTNIPVIASGGAGNTEHIAEAFTKGKADAALLAGMLHFNKLKIKEIKDDLRKKGIAIRE
ncbi:Imidazole glycerol phosphate synthase subunit HisF [Candidatus Gugararchaeum adminiculabundum]|nr:Imidazole glycerol phosphate synthase subunit HisF [Candidatus Gugararchaeum adminiculabundum]